LDVYLACAVHVFDEIQYHGNINCHRVISVAEGLRLPDSLNLVGTFFYKSLPVYVDQYVSPQTPNAPIPISCFSSDYAIITMKQKSGLSLSWSVVDLHKG
jgi:hypothetical protein